MNSQISQQIKFWIDDIDFANGKACVCVYEDDEDNFCDVVVEFDIEHEYTPEHYEQELGYVHRGYHEFEIDATSWQVVQSQGNLDWQALKDDILDDICKELHNQSDNQILDFIYG